MDFSDSKAEAWHSTAQFGVDYIDEIPSNDHNADAWVTFYFLWENDFGLSEDQSQAFYVSTETFLVVKGHGDCYARAGLIPLSDASSALGWSATLRILYWRKDLGTSPPPDPDQLALITELSAHDTSKGPFLPFKGDRQLIDVFRGYPLAHSNFTVGAGGLVVFEVTLNVASRLEGGGWCNSLFWNNYGFVACPYVELQLTPRVPV